jgi:hypothetical protein
MRQVCMRIRPASLTAAAPPSSCQVTHSVNPIEANAISNKAPPMAPSLAERLHDRGMRALYWRPETDRARSRLEVPSAGMCPPWLQEPQRVVRNRH